MKCLITKCENSGMVYNTKSFITKVKELFKKNEILYNKVLNKHWSITGFPLLDEILIHMNCFLTWSYMYLPTT
jgi:hypothetical protein